MTICQHLSVIHQSIDRSILNFYSGPSNEITSGSAKCTVRSPVSKHPHYRIALQQSVEFCGQLADSRYLWSGGRGIPTDDTAAAAAAGEGRGGERRRQGRAGGQRLQQRAGPARAE